MKRRLKPYLLALSLGLYTTAGYAQEIFSWSKNGGYCSPSVVGLPRAKALVVKYEALPNFTMRSTGRQGNYGNSTATLNKNRRLDLRLRFPIINKPSLTIAGGIKYAHEEFSFRSAELVRSTYTFYQDLEDRPLKSIGLHFYVIKPTRSNKYFVLRTSIDLNGDYASERFGKSESLKFSMTPLIGWKKNDNFTYAVGFSYGYTFGKPLIIPAVSINKNFTCNWGIESILPINVRIRYSPNDKNYFYSGFELAGGSYRLDNRDSFFMPFSRLHLFQSELRYMMNYERAIHDWLWFGVELGWRKNLRFNLTNGPKANSDVIVANKLSGALVANASIFIVPPKGMLRQK
ncbi:MAG: hypothetical protein JNK79_09345 [Chitinophagaceae bacterium]|nr:hypothetical protein [Chitinophagaceae bacterium]